MRTAFGRHRSREMDSEHPNITELKSITELLARRMKEIKEMDRVIQVTIKDPEQLSTEVEESLDFNKKIIYIMIAILQFFTINSKVAIPLVRTLQNNVSELPIQVLRVNLPHFNVKYFEGNPLHWDGFSFSVDTNPHKDVDKINYLNGTLKENVARIIAGLPITNDNYSKAIKLLKKRFGQN